MTKKKHFHQKNKWIGKVQPQDSWHEEDDELRGYFAFIQKLHPDTTIEENLQSLVELGFLSLRTNAQGNREYRLNRTNLQTALDKIPPEERHPELAFEVHECTAILCDYDNEMTNLLSIIIKQTNELQETSIIPWVIKTHDRLVFETLGLCPHLSEVLSKLEARNFIEITENGPARYRYRLNVSVVQTAIDALPNRGSEAAQ